MKIEGIYRWKLINKFTGKIEGAGQQKNLITDSLAQAFFTRYGVSKSNANARIVLSETSTPLPTAEYREYGAAAAAINRDTVSGTLGYSYDDAACIKTVNTNFSPPGTNKTWTIFALDFYHYGWFNFGSFIELTASVSQTTTQYLYIEYAMYMYFTKGLINGVDNDYIRNYLNAEIFERARYLAYRNGSTDNFLYITSLRSHTTLNNVGRSLDYAGYFSSSACPNEGCRYGQTPQRTFSISEACGPIGTSIWGYGAVWGIFVSSDIVPTISRVYVHPAAQYRQIFSDPANPPDSRASITLSGTPTNKVPIICRLKITQTGDASDIVDETFTTDYATNDQLTVSQDEWAVDDIVQLSSTGTLPSPLAISTDYYIVSKSGSSPTVLIELSLSEGGSVIELTDDGSGTHTISRQITGRYRLTMEPLTNILSSNTNYYGNRYRNIHPTVDLNSIPFNTTTYYSFAVIGREGDYIYTVHRDMGANQLMICRQLLYSVESSEPLHGFFGTSSSLYGAERGKGTYANMVYIATADGIYSYNFSSPATPTLMSITGMVTAEVRDLSFDEVTEYLWAGHELYLSRIDLSTNTATQYTNSTGTTAGLGDTHLGFMPGCMTAYNGYVFHFRYMNQGIWLMQDGVGWCYANYGYVRGGGTIHKSTGYIILRGATDWYVISVTGITGPGTGSMSTVESAATGYNSGNYYYSGNMMQISPNIFTIYFSPSNTSTTYVERYEVGVGFSYHTISEDHVGRYYYFSSGLPALAYWKNTMIPIDISEGNMGVYVNLSQYNLLGINDGGVPFGWTGSAWENGNANDRQIIETGIHSLGNGVSVAFNNATGENWDDQFVQDELFTFVISPVLVKDNLQEYTIKARSYYVSTKRVENWVTTAAATVRIPECPLGASPDADFRDLDFDPLVTEVYDVTTATLLTQVSSPPGDGEYSIDGLKDGVFEFHANQIGDSVRLTYNYTCYW